MDHQAFAQLLGNYGEFVGAIAVVATLIYLTAQLRQNTKAVRSSTMQSVHQSTIDVWKSTWYDIDSSKRFLALTTTEGFPNSLPTEEVLFCVAFALQSFRAQENVFYQNKVDALEGSFANLEKRTLVAVGGQFRVLWDAALLQPHLNDEYVAYVDNVISEHENVLTQEAD
jgi:hypothetical protein